jgi:transcriptional regulator with XRE-family HTH domain
MKNELGRLLYTTRIRRHHSMAQTGRKVGVHEKTISRWEGGEARPSLRHLAKLAKYLGIEADAVLELVNSQPERSHGNA